MPGFLITTAEAPVSIAKTVGSPRVTGAIQADRYSIARSTLAKFEDDKLFAATDEFIVITEGVVLNKAALMSEYKSESSFLDTVIEMYSQEGDSFFSRFRGSFSGALFIKAEQKWIIFTNHIGDKAVFYYQRGPDFAVASELSFLEPLFESNRWSCGVNEEAMYHLLTYGYMEGRGSPICEVFRLEAGQYLTYQNGELELKKYYGLSNDCYDLTGSDENEIIDELDQRFTAAVRLEYEKDAEYGYSHLANLSAGLDARVSVFAAASMGYKMDTMTFSQSGALDHLVAQEMSNYLGLNFYFKSLDTPTFIYDIDRTMGRNSGMALFSGPSGGPQFYDALNTSKYGVVHSGQLGDVIVGTYLGGSLTNTVSGRLGLYSTILSHRLGEFSATYDTNELYMLNVRGLKGILSSHLLIQENTEIVSPFCDVDMLDFCLSIPVQHRQAHALYKKWVILKYPEAAQFVWDTTRDKLYWPGQHVYREKFNRAVRRYGQDAPRKLKRIGRGLLSGKKLYPKVGMTPFEYWYRHLDAIRNFMDDYFAKHIGHPLIGETIREDMKAMYESGHAMEKSQVLSVLALYKRLSGQMH